MKFKLGTIDWLAPFFPSYQRVYSWELFLPLIPGANADLVSTRALEVRFGEYSISNLFEMVYGGYRYKYVYEANVPDCTITFVEKEDRAVAGYFLKWQRLIMDENGLFREKNKYAKSMIFTFNATSGEETFCIRLDGVFPTKMPEYRGTYRESGALLLDVTLNVDRISHENVGGITHRILGKAKGLILQGISRVLRRF